MAFRLIIDPDLRDSLEASLPGEILDDLSRALFERLAESPAQWSKPSELPFAPGHRDFSHVVFYRGGRYVFHVFFKYGQDEESLHIFAIRWT
jgi:hypothetical protein